MPGNGPGRDNAVELIWNRTLTVEALIMFLIVLVALAILAGLAFDWMSFQVTSERIVIAINIGKLTPTFRKLRDAASGRSRGHESLSQHHRRHCRSGAADND